MKTPNLGVHETGSRPVLAQQASMSERSFSEHYTHAMEWDAAAAPT